VRRRRLVLLAARCSFAQALSLLVLHDGRSARCTKMLPARPPKARPKGQRASVPRSLAEPTQTGALDLALSRAHHRQPNKQAAMQRLSALQRSAAAATSAAQRPAAAAAARPAAAAVAAARRSVARLPSAFAPAALARRPARRLPRRAAAADGGASGAGAGDEAAAAGGEPTSSGSDSDDYEEEGEGEAAGPPSSSSGSGPAPSGGDFAAAAGAASAAGGGGGGGGGGQAVSLARRVPGVEYTFLLAGALKIMTLGAVATGAPTDVARTVAGKYSPYLLVPVGLAAAWLAKTIADAGLQESRRCAAAAATTLSLSPPCRCPSACRRWLRSPQPLGRSAVHRRPPLLFE